MKVHELFEEEEVSILSKFGKHFAKHSKFYANSISAANVILTSLEGCPEEIDGSALFGSNHLTSLKGGPRKVTGDFSITGNITLTSLDFAPEYVGENFRAEDCNITSLHNIHKHVKHIGDYLLLKGNPITSHVLGVLLIDGLKMIQMDFKPVQHILNNHLKGDRDVFACQEELIEAGYEEFAQL